MTEALPPTMATPINAPPEKVLSIGVTTLYYQALIVDTDMRELEPDGRGEILLKGPCIFKEYWLTPRRPRKRSLMVGSTRVTWALSTRTGTFTLTTE